MGTYILADEPIGGIGKEAFDALDGAFGTDEFAYGQALTVITNALEVENAEAILRDLIRGGAIISSGEPSGAVSRLKRFVRPMPSMPPVGPHVDTDYSGNGQGPGVGEKALGGLGKLTAAMMKGTGKVLDGAIRVSKRRRR